MGTFADVFGATAGFLLAVVVVLGGAYLIGAIIAAIVEAKWKS